MRTNTGNSSSGSEIGEAVVVELGLNLQNLDPSFFWNHNSKSSSAVDHHDGDGHGSSVKSPVNCSAPFEFVKGLQTFDSPLFNPSGGGGMGFEFTRGQWKELERQAMIYKYMVASLPVPPQLLYSSFSTSLSPSYFVGGYGNVLNLRWVGNSKDAEPGRCRRTDGKKWRCSRDVAPNQKYCERHMHRGRPRSRKPVELHHHSLSNPTTTNNKIKNANPNTKKTRLSDPNIQPVTASLPSVSLSNASTFDHPKSLAWAEEQQQWQQLVQTNPNPSVFQQQFDGVPLNLNSNYAYNPKSETPLLGLAEHQDSYGNDHCNAFNENMCQMHMSLVLIDSPGGPLAEVLRRPDVSEVEFLTPPATAVSSPSGVLQKSHCSFSDSSGSSTPTYKAKSDMTFNWMS